VLQLAGVGLLFFGMLGKFGALFVTIPDPVMGGVFLIMFGKLSVHFFALLAILLTVLSNCCTVVISSLYCSD